MPADNVDGFRPEVLALLRELDSPVYRWPGGNFVSGYDWRDGIGDRDRRPPRKNPAWTGVEHNDVGIHEYMDLMRLIGAEPYITVNSGLGDVVHGPRGGRVRQRRARDRRWAGCRAANGHPEPWGVKFWAIGNEMYGDWQLGNMPLSDYVKKHTQFAVAMKAMDPAIQVVAVGAVGRWSETMLAEASNHMDLISEHFYVQHKPGLLGHVNQAPAEIRRIAEAHRKYRATIPTLKAKEVPVALDEWNYWYGPHVYGELGTQYFLEDALGDRRRPQRVRPADRHLLHGQLRPDGQRHRGHQDLEDGGRPRLDGRHPGALPEALRDDPGRGRRRARAARRHGLLEGRGEKRPDAVDRQSDEAGR